MGLISSGAHRLVDHVIASRATDVVLRLVMSYPVELNNVPVLAAQASETVKVPELVLHVTPGALLEVWPEAQARVQLAAVMSNDVVSQLVV